MPTAPGQTRDSYASGEVTPTIRAANDLARFQTGVELCENMVVAIEAVLMRRPGTRFIAPVKTEGQAGKMFPFRFSGSEYYGLAFNGGQMRLIKDGGVVESSPGAPFELAVPWIEADMPNLRSAPVGNLVTQTCSGKAPQQITRTGALSWSMAQYRPQNGPIGAQNLDKTKTIRASALTGTGIALIGTGNPFTAGMVDGIFRLDEANQWIVPQWQADETITIATEAIAGATGQFGDTADQADAFDSDTGTASIKAGSATAYLGQVYSPASSIMSVTVTTYPTGGFVQLQTTYELYAKNGLPANATDGTLLGTGGPGFLSTTATVLSNNVTDTFTHFWVRAIGSGEFPDQGFTEIAFTRAQALQTPVLRRWQNNVYQALSAGDAGVNAPVHTDGDASAGNNSVVWRFLYPGYGYAQITAVADANNATADVLSRLPDSLITNPSYRWYPPAWCDDAGWPNNVFAFKQRLGFLRDDTHWMTQPATIDRFDLTVNDDSAIARRLIDENGSRVLMRWAVASGGVLLYGMHDNEWVVSRPKTTEAFSSNNIDEDPSTSEGSCEHIPAVLERGAVFIGRDGKRLHHIRFDASSGGVLLNEITVACRHIFGVKAVGMAWQQHPNKILWIHLEDGTLASVTFMPAEKVTGWARHPMTNCFVEDMISIPTSDNGASDVILQTRRTINGSVHRYYEQLAPFFAPLDKTAPTAEGAWFVDCGLRYQGAATQVISGLDHLIGETVRVLANGVQRPDCVVSSTGTITLGEEATDVIVGLPITARVKDLPRSAQVAGVGTGHGGLQRASHIAIDVYQSIGGTARFNDQSEYNDLTETGAMDYGAPLPLVTKTIRKSLASATADELALDIVIDNALPFTLCATTPVLEIEDKG